jgi:hypothetical protein
MEKKPTAISIQEIQIIIIPIKGIAAPMSQTKPAAPNIFSPDRVESASKDFLNNTAETTNEI